MVDNLQAKIRRYQDAVNDTAEDQYGIRAGLFKKVGRRYMKIYEMTKSADDLDKAIRHLEDAVSASKREGGLAPVDHLTKLRDALIVRYNERPSLADLDLSIRALRDIVNIYPVAGMVRALGRRIRDRYLWTGSRDDLKEAIGLLQKVVDCMGTNIVAADRAAADRAASLYELGLGILDFHQETRSSEDLDKAIRIFQEAVDLVSLDQTLRMRYSHGLALGLCHRYIQRGSEVDLQKAIEIQQGVVEFGSEDSEEQAGRSGTLGNMFYYQYRRTGLDNDLHLSITFQRSAIAKTPTHSRYIVQRLNSLAVSLRELYLRTGCMQHLDEALKSAKAVFQTPVQEHPKRRLWLHNIGLLFLDRYFVTRSMDDLDNSIFHQETAVKDGRRDHLEEVERLSSFVATVRERYKRIGSKGDFEAALSYGQEVIEKTPAEDLNYATCLSNLGGIYLDRYIWEPKNVDALDEAVRLRRLAVDKTPKEHRDRAEWSSNLGTVLMYRSEERASIEDLEEAIRLKEAAIDSTPAGHPKSASRLNDVGVLLYKRYEMYKSSDDLQKALDYLLRSLRHANGTPFERVKSGIRAGNIAIHEGKWQEAARYLTESIDILPRVVIRSNSSNDHQDNLKQLSNLGPLAASVFIEADKSALESLQVLEKARGVISSLVIDSRSDISLLKERYPDVCSEYEGIRDIVATPSFSQAHGTMFSTSLPPEDYASISLHRSQSITKLGEIEDKIRKIPGFERFHLAPTEEGLCELAREGLLVSYNITAFGSHAFVISTKGVKVLLLPRISLQDLEEYVRRMQGGNKTRRDVKAVSLDGNSTIESVHSSKEPSESLRSLWNGAVEPVLARAGLLTKTDNHLPLPCVWWVGGGLMSLLPVHAAGDQIIGSTRNTMSHVVSSYIPTFKALQFSREKVWNPPRSGNDKLLIIAMPETPGEYDLDISREVAAIRQHIGSSASVEILQRPGRQEVLEKVTNCSLVHFACHGYADAQDPSQSALLLGSGTVDRLTLNDLRPLNHQLAQVAYLSACSTAEIGVRSLIDESIHLASTFQLLGFRHVIGTLWVANDAAAVAVAASFYERLLQKPDEPSAVARALHHAAMVQKRAYSDSFNWVPFIHMGP